jgi:tetratricopeptide (TPR) repeat protein
VFIYQRGLKQFTDSCETHMDYGAFNNLIKNYSAAIQFLEEGERCNMDENDSDFWRMQYGYALYMTAQNEKALQVLQPLINSANAYPKHMALYFTAKIFIIQKRKDEAIHLLNSIVHSGESTKYVALAQKTLNSIR